VSDFASIHLTPAIERAFEQDGVREPTAIQTAAVEPILQGHHVVLESGTGTGKTLAYLLPLLQRLNENPQGRTVVITPSAELAVQVLGIARRYREPTVSIVGVVAGGNPKHTKDRLQKSTRLIIGSAGRILELYSQRKLKGVTTLVLDEPDPILVGDTPRYLREILSRPDPKVQVIIVGATMGPKAEALVQDVMGERAVRVRATDGPLQTRIAHHFVRVNPQAREVALARFLENQNCARAIVFLNQAQRIRHLYRYLEEHWHRPATLSEERSKMDRRIALDAFVAGKARVLLTTDAAARGIDIPEVDWVMHYEPATSAPGYLHRAGRTGRAGREGTSVAFVSDPELATLQQISSELEIDCAPWHRS
jgi:ATP-dependent RNA helicase DeaD